MRTAQRAFIVLAALALTVGAVQVLAADDAKIARGELVRVDTDASILTIKAADGTETEFKYTDQTEVTGVEESVAGLATEAGAQVTVHYMEEAGVKTATRIDVQAALDN
jgi:hypothetical protein